MYQGGWEVFKHKLKRWSKANLGGRYGEKSGSKRQGFSVVQEVFGLCAVLVRPKLINRCRPENKKHKRVRETVENHLQPRRRKGARQEEREGGKSKRKGKESPRKSPRS